MTNILSEKAMLATLTIHSWSARKHDKKVTKETNKRNNATDDAGRYNKLLVSSEVLKELASIGGAARMAHYVLTLPWLDTGARILPTAHWEKYTKEMREFETKYKAQLEKFVSVYPTVVEEAKVRLNGMFDEEDYPHVDDIREKFGFTRRLLPCPDASDFRVDLASEVRDDIADQIRAEMKEALRVAMQAPIHRIMEHVGNMVDRLGSYKPAKAGSGDRAEGDFKSSLVTNLRDLVELLPAFNLTNNPALDDLTKRIARDLCANDMTDLKANATVRKATKTAAEKIFADAEALMA